MCLRKAVASPSSGISASESLEWFDDRFWTADLRVVVDCAEARGARLLTRPGITTIVAGGLEGLRGHEDTVVAFGRLCEGGR